jgi:hypothetical protein
MFLKELESWLERGQNASFLREICPPKKCTPNIGAITGILLINKEIDTKHIVITNYSRESGSKLGSV